MQTKEPQLASQSTKLSWPPSISFLRVARQKQESISVDDFIPRQDLCVFLKWFSFHPLYIASAFLSFRY